MKKLNALLLVCAILLTTTALTACAKKPKIENKNPSSNISNEPSEPISSSEQSSEMSSAPPSSEPASSEETSPVDAKILEQNLYTDEQLLELEKLENEITGWGQGVRVDEKNRPETCDPAQEKYGEHGGLFIMPDEENEPKKMYLTFDEGYEAGFTPQILDALKEKNVPAVFFVTMDYVKSQPDLVKRMIDEGHVIGNHSVKHKVMPSLTVEEAIAEITGLHNYMVENYNYQMTLFRPPEGKYSTRTMQIAKDLGYKTVLWSFAYKDYDVKEQMGVDKAFPKVTKMAHNGAIYLLHAVSKDNADMLGDLIDNFREQGFELEKLS